METKCKCKEMYCEHYESAFDRCVRENKETKHPNIITKHDYYSSFKLWEKVTYLGEPGIVTFLHEPKKDGDIRFTVKVSDVETRYVNPFGYGYNKGVKLLRKRKPVDYSKVEVPKVVKSLTTEQLLKRLDSYRKHTYCYDYNQTPLTEELHIKAELSTREHIPNKKEKKANRTIAKKHGGSKSKSR